MSAFLELSQRPSDTLQKPSPYQIWEIALILKDMQVHYPNTDIYLSVYEERKLFKNPISERWGKQICLN